MGKVTMARDDEDAVHKVDTVPPPAGDQDAYSAETRVGPVTQDAWAELIRKAAEDGAASPSSSRRSASGAPANRAEPPTSGVSPRSTDVADVDAALPRVYEEEEHDDAATVLSPRARPPQIDGGATAAPATPLAAHAEPAAARPAPPPAALAPLRTPASPMAPASAFTSTVPSAQPFSSPPPVPSLPAPAPARPGGGVRAMILVSVLCLVIFGVGLAIFLTAP